MGKCPQRDGNNKCIPANPPYRIDDVKDVIKDQIINNKDLNSVKISLFEFGNYKAYGLQSQDRCTAIKEVVKGNLKNQDKILNGLNQITANDDGVTPLSSAIGRVVNKQTKEGLVPFSMILFTDGQPNCSEFNPLSLSQTLAGFVAQGQIKKDVKFYIVPYQAAGPSSQEFFDAARDFPNLVEVLPAKNKSDLGIVTKEIIIQVVTPPNRNGYLCSIKNIVTVFLLAIGVIILILLLLVFFGLITLTPRLEKLATIIGPLLVPALGVLAAILQNIPCS